VSELRHPFQKRNEFVEVGLFIPEEDSLIVSFSQHEKMGIRNGLNGGGSRLVCGKGQFTEVLA
jgi:hypothetical protein